MSDAWPGPEQDPAVPAGLRADPAGDADLPVGSQAAAAPPGRSADVDFPAEAEAAAPWDPDADADSPAGGETVGPSGPGTDPADLPVASAPAGVPGPRIEVAADAPPEVLRVAQAVAALDEVDRVGVGEHVQRYEALHGELADALAAIDGV